MKKLFKSVLFWVLLIEAIVIIVLAIMGFKITYAPSLDNSWEAISAAASWLSAIATIFIPIVVVLFQHKLDQNKSEINKSLIK